MIEVEAVNIGQRFALLTDGRTVPVTNLFDADGDETEVAAEAVVFVAGEGATWFAGLLSAYEGTQVQ